MRFSRVQGEDAESKPTGCRLKEEEREEELEKKKKLGRSWKGMCLPLTSQPCVGCCQMPHILCITTRQLFVALDPCNSEIRFCLCIRSSCKGAKRSQNKKLVHLNSLSLSFPSSSQTGAANSLLSAFLHQLVVPAGICIAASGERAGCVSGGSSPRAPWPLLTGRSVVFAQQSHSGELLAGKVWGEHRPATHASQGWRCSCQVAVEQAHGYNNKIIRCKKTLCKMAQAIRPMSSMWRSKKYPKTYC